MASRSDDWQRLAEKVAARRGALGLTQDQLAKAAGIEKRTLGSIERDPGPRRATTLGGLERALGWAEGSIRRVLKGGEPVLTDEYEIQVQGRGSKQDAYAKLDEIPDSDEALAKVIAILDEVLADIRRRNAK